MEHFAKETVMQTTQHFAKETVMQTTQHGDVEHVYGLLESYGPATAYNYMERSGGVDNFPSSLVRIIRVRLKARLT
jgi:hypothetical protein